MFVFLVDQNPLITEWLKRQAQLLGVPFYSMTSLAEAAYFIQDLKPDVLVLDGKSVALSESFLLDMKAYEFIQQLPVIGLGDPLPAWTSGLNLKGHLTKPLDPSCFHEEVARLLSR